MMNDPSETALKKRKKTPRRSLNKKQTAVLMTLAFLSPWLIGFLAFSLYPFIQMIRYSVSNVIFRPNNTIYEYVGGRNFQRVLFVDPDFRLMLLDYLRLVLLLLPLIMVLALVLATLLNKIEVGQGFFRSIYFLPVILISGPLLEDLFSIEAFTMDGLRHFFIFEFLEQVMPAKLNSLFFYIMDNIILALWSSGVQLLIFLAGMQRIDASIYEAAQIEGASNWQLFWKITIPMLKPFVVLNAVYTLVDLSSSPQNPLAGLVTTSTSMDNRGYGYAAAVAWLYLAIQLIILALVLFILARDHEGARKRREKRQEARKIARIRKRRSRAARDLKAAQ